jgi:energy-coupling factor transporter ATP-binding protein EcfA2
VDVAGVRFELPDGRVLLDDVSFRVGDGAKVALVGANGAGKTTLLLALNGVVPHLLTGTRTGSVVVAGRDPLSTTVREMARDVAMVFDDPAAQLSQPTAADEVALGLENLGVPWEAMGKRIGEALDAVGLAGLEARDPATLSGGEQQRLAIACAIAMRPRLLVMDEPTAGLDPAGRAAVYAIAARLNREDGITVVIADHAVEALAEHARRIVVLDAGEVVLDGAPPAVFGALAAAPERGAGVPEVTALAAMLAPAGDRTVPVTLDEGAAWLTAAGWLEAVG